MAQAQHQTITTNHTTMTTQAAAAMYEARHIHAHSNLPVAVFNPEGKPLNDLPVIYGFNNGGSHFGLYAVLIAEDGTLLGEHICSSEAYMPADIGVLEGTRPDRHDDFRAHYSSGYRMEFVGEKDIFNHPGLNRAIQLNQERFGGDESTTTREENLDG
jgi:hypothetical protein